MTAPTVTPSEDVAPLPETLPFASVGRRAAGVLLDTVVLFSLGWVVAAVTGNNRGLSYTIYGPDFVVMTTLFVLYLVAMERWVGATLGKLVLGIRVVDEQGQHIDLVSSIIRNLLRIVDSAFGYLVAAIFAWNSPRVQRLGDRVAGTFVVLTRSTAQRLATAGQVQGGMFLAFPQGALVVKPGLAGSDERSEAMMLHRRRKC